jgi:uncharacterized membrane protein YdbT with pleckstrin-like domain
MGDKMQGILNVLPEILSIVFGWIILFLIVKIWSLENEIKYFKNSNRKLRKENEKLNK